ncbi:MAG: hypothetical protein JO091_11955 [Acidobacteriaceae bacterium]|nr:hypothetical protein [Acidobacteriaceae bacterium]
MSLRTALPFLLFAAPLFADSIQVVGSGYYAYSFGDSTCAVTVSGPDLYLSWIENLPAPNLGANCFTGLASPFGLVTGTASIGSIVSPYFRFDIGGGGGDLTLYDNGNHDHILAETGLLGYYFASPPMFFIPNDPFDFRGYIIVSIQPIPEPANLFLVGTLYVLGFSILKRRDLARGFRALLQARL